MLPKHNRLQKKKDIDAVLKRGRAFSSAGLTLKIRENKLPASRFTFIVGKRVAQKAVERNKIRRTLAEIVRRKLRRFKKNVDGLFIVRQEKGSVLRETEEIVEGLLSKARLL